MEKIKLLSIRLKELREALNLSQSDFSESIDLKQQTYSAYEKAINKPPIDILIKIAEKYNVSLDWLCGFSNLQKKKINLDTYADILNLIFTLGLLDGAEVDSGFFKYGDDEQHPLCDSQYSDFMMIYFDDTTINGIMKEWKKMLDLYKSGTIDEELYCLWMEKTVSKHISFYNADKNVRKQNLNIPNTSEFPFT